MLFSGLPRVLLMLKTSLKAVGEVLINNNSSKLLCLHHRMSCTNEQRNTQKLGNITVLGNKLCQRFSCLCQGCLNCQYTLLQKSVLKYGQNCK